MASGIMQDSSTQDELLGYLTPAAPATPVAGPARVSRLRKPVRRPAQQIRYIRRQGP